MPPSTRRSVLAAMTAASLVPTARIARAQDGADPDARFAAALLAPGAPPAVAAALVDRDRILWSGEGGRRRADGDDAVTARDRWHLGSHTKAMTTALYARLCDQGLAQWDATLGDVFDDPAVDPALAATPVVALMRHVAGIEDAGALPPPLVLRADTRPAPVQRADLARAVLSRPPNGAPGRFAYGNLNYILLGAAIERITGRAWEDLVADEVFEPLGLASAGLGAPLINTAGGPNAWGHRVGAGTADPVDPASPFADNPPVMGPAGTAHMTVADYAGFVQAILGGAPGWLSPDALGRLTTPDPAAPEYALGWIVQDGPHGRRLAHEGSNTLWHAVALADPDRGRAAVVLSNGGLAGRTAALPLAVGLLG